MYKYECIWCGDEVSPQRHELGYHLCLKCGDEVATKARAKWTIAPLNKSNYMLITDITMLGMLNPKRTQ